MMAKPNKYDAANLFNDGVMYGLFFHGEPNFENELFMEGHRLAANLKTQVINVRNEALKRNGYAPIEIVRLP